MTGVAVDKRGYVYLQIVICITLKKLNRKKGGVFIRQFGSKSTAEGKLNCPSSLLLSQSGLLFVCNIDNYRIQVFKDETVLGSVAINLVPLIKP